MVRRELKGILNFSALLLGCLCAGMHKDRLCSMRTYLHCLSQAHLIGQNAIQLLAPQGQQPAEALQQALAHNTQSKDAAAQNCPAGWDLPATGSREGSHKDWLEAVSHRIPWPPPAVPTSHRSLQLQVFSQGTFSRSFSNRGPSYTQQTSTG